MRKVLQDAARKPRIENPALVSLALAAVKALDLQDVAPSIREVASTSVVLLRDMDAQHVIADALATLSALGDPQTVAISRSRIQDPPLVATAAIINLRFAKDWESSEAVFKRLKAQMPVSVSVNR